MRQSVALQVRNSAVVLGIVALLVGVINVKGFFAFHQGITLSIPASAKPGICRRVREIVSANQLTTAFSGAIVLAIVVNIVELLCIDGSHQNNWKTAESNEIWNRVLAAAVRPRQK